MTAAITLIVCFLAVVGVFLFLVVQAEYSFYQEEQRKRDYHANYEMHKATGRRIEPRKSWGDWAYDWWWWGVDCFWVVMGCASVPFLFVFAVVTWVAYFISFLFEEMIIEPFRNNNQKDKDYWKPGQKTASSLYGRKAYKKTGNQTVESAAEAREVYNKAISEKRSRMSRSLADVAKEIREDQIIRGFVGLTADELAQFDAERDEDDIEAEKARKEVFNDMPWDNIP